MAERAGVSPFRVCRRYGLGLFIAAACVLLGAMLSIGFVWVARHTTPLEVTVTALALFTVIGGVTIGSVLR